MKKIFVADAHCDTIGEMYNTLNLYSGKGQLDLKRMNDYKGWLQVFAVWINPKNDTEFIRKRFFEITDNYYAQAKENESLFLMAKDKDELKKCAKEEKCTGILAVEGGEIIDKDISYLDVLYERGVRIITLTWNYDNAIGCGADCKKDNGLSEFGREVIREMNKKSIIADISHASEKTFWDVCMESKKAIMASHSNARALCEHKRNLTDEQIKQIIDVNGFIGINYFPEFLNKSCKADVYDIIRHIEYFMALGAENVLGLGSDFDGIDYTPEGMSGAEDVYRIAEELLKLNYSEETTKKVMGKNLYDFLLRELN